MTPPDTVEIVEDGIDMIYSRTFGPYMLGHQAKVKWFRDELDQVWVKFSVRSEIRGVYKWQDHVLPAEEIRRVVYAPRDAPWQDRSKETSSPSE